MSWRGLVDDDPGVRELVAAVLEDEGYATRQAADGLAALAAVGAGPVDLVLADVMMPRLDGVALVRRLRAGGHRVPVVLMSAAVAGVDVAGAPFLRKPFDLDGLLGVVAGSLAPEPA